MTCQLRKLRRPREAVGAVEAVEAGARCRGLEALGLGRIYRPCGGHLQN